MENISTPKKSNNMLFAAIFLAVIIIIVLILTSFFSIYSNNEALSKGKVVIKGKTINVDIAQTPEQLSAGLKGRLKLKDNQGMLFIFKEKRYYNFWMDGMKIPIDIIWIEDDHIIDITANALVPQNANDAAIYKPSSEVNYVLEVNAGFAEKNNIQKGDMVEISYK